MKNKKGQAVGWIIAVALIVGLVFGGVAMYNSGLLGGTGQQVVNEQQELNLGDCETVPTLSTNFNDRINPGTSLSGDMKARVNGQYKGAVTTSTAFVKGDRVELLVNSTNYISTTIPELTMGCGANGVSAQLYKLDGTPTVKVRGSAGSFLTDLATGGAVNETAVATPINVQVEFTAPADEAIDGMVIVVESSNDTQVRELTLSSSSASVSRYSKNKPDFHALEGNTNSIIRSFRVTNVADDGALTSFNLNIEPESGQTIDANNFYITWYIEDSFVDQDGTFKVGIENSDGTAKHVSAASSDYDFHVT